MLYRDSGVLVFFIFCIFTFSFPFEVFCWYISLSAYLYLYEECYVCIVNKKRVKTRKKNINMQWEVKYVGRVVSSLPGCRTCRNILSTNSTLAKMQPQGGDFKITFGGSSYFSDWRSFCFTTEARTRVAIMFFHWPFAQAQSQFSKQKITKNLLWLKKTINVNTKSIYILT